MPGRADDAHLQAVDLDDVAVAEALRPQPVLRVERAHPAADPVREGPRRLGVVEVPVRQQHDGHPVRVRRDGVRCR